MSTDREQLQNIALTLADIENALGSRFAAADAADTSSHEGEPSDEFLAMFNDDDESLDFDDD